MYNQQAYPTFTLNPGVMQEGFGSYLHPSQAFFSSTVKPENSDFGVQPLGDQPTQVMTWNPLTTVQLPSNWTLHGPPHQMETPCDLLKKEDKAEVTSFTVLGSAQYYPHYLDNTSWQGNPQKSISVPDSHMYATIESMSPPGEPAATNIESSQCNSASTKEAAKKHDAAVTGSSPAAGNEALFGYWENMPETPSEMEQFVKEVRTKRVSLGYTQADVGFALGILNGQTFSQTTICRFESFQLSYKNMCRLKPFLHRWLEAAGKDENLEQKMHSGEAQAFVNRYQKRKQRTNLENKVKFSLETYFLRNPKPGRMEMTQIAEELKTDYDVVRVWFCNRRQKEKQYLSDKCSRDLYEVQHMVHPPMQASPLPQETTYMAPPAGTTAAVYTTAFSQKNEVSMLHAMPYGMPVGD